MARMLRAISRALSRAGSKFLYVNAASEKSGNEDFDGTIWGLADEGVDDSFIGVNSDKQYIKFIFDEDTKNDLTEQGYGEYVSRYAGVMLTFPDATTDNEPTLQYFRDEAELNSEFSLAETNEGGRQETEDEADEETEESEEESDVVDFDEDGDGMVSFEELIWGLVDEIGCDESIGEETDGIGWYGLFKLDGATRERIIEEGFEEDLSDIAGAVVFYREGAEGEEDEESMDFYAPGDLDEAWRVAQDNYKETAAG